MPNRVLTAEEREMANALLAEIRVRLSALANGDRELLFAYRRKIFKELTYDERSGPTARRKLKALKRLEQGNRCTICGKPLPDKYAVLDRFNAVDGYTQANTRLIHPECDISTQHSRGYG
jgi:hypothetical protein